MAEQKTADQEPSIEEILNSIRQIISDDEEGESQASDAKGGSEAGEDVIELTERLEPEPRPEPQSVFKPPPEPVIPQPEPIEVDMKESEPEPLEKSGSDDFGSILTSKAESAAYEGFSELARKTAVEHDGITLEEIVRTELKPLLREWLNKNLPAIIERLVREELERVAKKALEE